MWSKVATNREGDNDTFGVINASAHATMGIHETMRQVQLTSNMALRWRAIKQLSHLVMKKSTV